MGPRSQRRRGGSKNRGVSPNWEAKTRRRRAARHRSCPPVHVRPTRTSPRSPKPTARPSAPQSPLGLARAATASNRQAGYSRQRPTAAAAAAAASSSSSLPQRGSPLTPGSQPAFLSALDFLFRRQNFRKHWGRPPTEEKPCQSGRMGPTPSGSRPIAVRAFSLTPPLRSGRCFQLGWRLSRSGAAESYSVHCASVL